MTHDARPSDIDWDAIAKRAARDAASSDPAFAVDAARLGRHLVELRLDGEPPHLDDLVLAFAAASGDPVAIAELHRQVLHAARTTLGPANYAEHVIEDAGGELMLTLLGEPSKPSPLWTYRGRAALTAWLRTLVARLAIRLRELSQRQAPAGDHEALIELASSTDLMRDLARAELRSAARHAFEIAAQRLSYFDRELLADVVIRGRSVEAIAEHHGLHRTTAARWVARARAALDRELRKELGRNLVATPSEVDSILDSLQSSLDLSVERLLR